MNEASSGTGVITAAMICNWFEKSAEVIANNRAHLTELDAPIGDSDHGNNMDRGYKAILEKLPRGEDGGGDIGAIFKLVAMTLISKVGGASGPLYGTLFLEGGKPLSGKSELTAEELARFFDDAIAGVIKRGKAEVGMKTMLDALVPSGEAFKAALSKGNDITSALAAAANGAREGMEATIPMLAQRGRASYLGERSIGHQDPGATSWYLILQALADTVAEAS